jgi:hypothetical protein
MIIRCTREPVLRAVLFFGSLLLVANAFGATKDYGYIKARGNPGDAGLFINGKYIGPAARFTVPEKYHAPLGEVEVSIRDPRSEDFTSKVMVQPGKTVHLQYHLRRLEPAKPPFGTFRLSGGTPESGFSLSGGDIGAVYINDKYYGYVEELNNVGSGILLNPGTYDLHIESPLLGDIRQKITIEANKTTMVPLPNRP